MKQNYLLALTILSSTLLWSSWASADFESAMQAQRSGKYDIAFTEFKKASEAGDERAHGKLAGMYLYGLGTEKDYSKAYIWFGIALHTGDKYAGKFKKAASSAMTIKQVEDAEKELSVLQAKYPAVKK